MEIIHLIFYALTIKPPRGESGFFTQIDKKCEKNMKKITKLFVLFIVACMFSFAPVGAYDDIEGGIGGGYAYATSYEDQNGSSLYAISNSYYEDGLEINTVDYDGAKLIFEFPNVLCDRVYWEELDGSCTPTVKVYYTDGSSKSLTLYFGQSSMSLSTSKYVDYIEVYCNSGFMGATPHVGLDQMRCRLA